jgi:hypothetical protein
MQNYWRRTPFYFAIFLEVGKTQDLQSKIWQTLGDAHIIRLRPCLAVRNFWISFLRFIKSIKHILIIKLITWMD